MDQSSSDAITIDLDAWNTLERAVELYKQRTGASQAPVGKKKLLEGIRCTDPENRLTAAEIGNRFLVRLRDVDDWIARQRPKPRPIRPTRDEKIERDVRAQIERKRARARVRVAVETQTPRDPGGLAVSDNE